MEPLAFIGSIVLCVFCGYLYFTRDNSHLSKITHRVEDIDSVITQITSDEQKRFNENKAFASTTVEMLSDLNRRISNIEKADHAPQNISLNLKQPVHLIIDRRPLPEAPQVHQPLAPRENN